jgi:hypothetical protein
MILPDLFLKEFANKTFTVSGIDSLQHAFDKKHFLNYPNKILYNYNTRGFRDSEWPDSLKDKIWCIGDSFTVGLGSPYEYIWPQVLQAKSGQRCINISMDGASNEWIARKAISIINEIEPKFIIIHWSFIWRTELDNQTLPDEKRRLYFLPDDNFASALSRFVATVKKLESQKKSTRIIYSTIPGFTDYTVGGLQHLWRQFKGSDWPNHAITSIEDFRRLPEFIKKELENLLNFTEENFTLFLQEYSSLASKSTWIEPFTKLDLARDGFHYDIITANKFAEKIAYLICNCNGASNTISSS